MMACASRYVGYGAGDDVRVTLWPAVCEHCVCVCVDYDTGNIMWLVMSR